MRTNVLAQGKAEYGPSLLWSHEQVVSKREGAGAEVEKVFAKEKGKKWGSSEAKFLEGDKARLALEIALFKMQSADVFS